MGARVAKAALGFAIALVGMGVFGYAAPDARAGNGDCVAEVHVPAGANYDVAFDGTYLYYSTQGEPALHRILPPGAGLGVSDPNTGCPEYDATTRDQGPIPIVGLLPASPGVQVVTFDAVSTDELGTPVFWAVGDFGRDVYKLVYNRDTNVFVAELQYLIPDTSLPGGCKVDNTDLSACPLEVDGVAFDAVGKLVWYSPAGTHRIYAFDTAGQACNDVDVPCPTNFGFDVAVGTGLAVTAGWFDVDDTAPMAPYCENVDSGIAIGGPATPSSGGTEIETYLFSPRCTNWFRYGADPSDTPVRQQVYSTFNGVNPADDECDSDTFNTPVVWVRDHDDFWQLKAYAVSTCTTGGGVKIADSARMTGGGGIPVVDPSTDLPTTNEQAHHGFTIHCNGFDQPNDLQVSANGNVFHLSQLDAASVTCTTGSTLLNGVLQPTTTIKGDGLGRWNEHLCRKPQYDCATVHFEFTDAGEPGTFDNGKIRVTYNGVTVLAAGGALVTGSLPGEGNYQYHPGKSA